MTAVIARHILAALAAEAHVPGASSVRETIAAAPPTMAVPVSVPAVQLRHTYDVRRRRWEATGKPRSQGLPEFAEAIAIAGDNPVTIVTYAIDGQCVHVLLTAEADRLLGAMTTEEPSEVRGS